MNIFGVGGPELIAILIIMLVFAGPKRMIHWSYIMGQYIAKFRVIWSQTVDLVQKEFDDAGVDIKIPKQPPTRQNFNKTVSDALKPMTQPFEESLNEVKGDIESVKDIDNEVKEVMTSTSVKSSTPAYDLSANKKTELGTWEEAAEKLAEPEPSPNATSDMGTWSTPATDK